MITFLTLLKSFMPLHLLNPIHHRRCTLRPRPVLLLGKIPQFHIISWCGNFVKRHSLCIVLGGFPHQENRWNYGVSRSVLYCEKAKYDLQILIVFLTFWEVFDKTHSFFVPSSCKFSPPFYNTPDFYWIDSQTSSP